VDRVTAYYVFTGKEFREIGIAKTAKKECTL
jgi:hypothetical protein